MGFLRTYNVWSIIGVDRVGTLNVFKPAHSLRIMGRPINEEL